jgi:uncharacterized protein YndB with AHSA1/START domain
MTAIFEARTLNVSIACAPAKVYGFVTDPENLPKWATAFCKSVRRSNAAWIVETPQGNMKIRFAEQNAYGVMDHYVTAPSGEEICVPMRVLPNGTGSEVLFTLFRTPGMPEEKFVEDIALVAGDLRTLKNVLEAAG